MDIRIARDNDWGAIRALLLACELPLDGAREHLANFVVADEGEIIGSAGAEIYGDAALLRSLAVAAPRRGQGLGEKLFDAMLRTLRRHAVRDIVLLTTTAERFFQRRGFRAVERSAVPAAVRLSAEFTSACPDTAVAMMRRLGP